MGKLRYDLRSSLTGIEDIEGVPVANVTTKGTMRLDVDPEKLQAPAGGPRVEVRMTRGEYDGQVMFDLTRHEAVGRNSVETRAVEVTLRYQGKAMVRRQTETIRGQTYRIAESDGR